MLRYIWIIGGESPYGVAQCCLQFANKILCKHQCSVSVITSPPRTVTKTLLLVFCVIVLYINTGYCYHCQYLCFIDPDFHKVSTVNYIRVYVRIGLLCPVVSAPLLLTRRPDNLSCFHAYHFTWPYLLASQSTSLQKLKYISHNSDNILIIVNTAAVWNYFQLEVRRGYFEITTGRKSSRE
jgi:hypothetical protein